VRERTDELARLSHELALAEVRERQSIARDLHDGLGQELNAAFIKPRCCSHTNPEGRSDAALDEIAELPGGGGAGNAQSHGSAQSPVLEQLGLMPAIEC